MTPLFLSVVAPPSGQGGESASPMVSSSHGQPHMRRDHPLPAAPPALAHAAPSTQPALNRAPLSAEVDPVDRRPKPVPLDHQFRLPRRDVHGPFLAPPLP
jgi:hypothetical protein